ncbi:hypothetical protein Ahu01nite_018370 [Winogradskya humida]|uniref:Uncharacterized protein n=1 Tax=Winogradskya humida TaxID=113566 RepID=A0ABQ3ZJG6_9ACTN|nr:hypothetical protein Ahu01nite_018370 [Actinoplanes humidus]
MRPGSTEETSGAYQWDVERVRAYAGLISALAAGTLLLALPPAAQGKTGAPAPLSVAWPTASKAALPATLPDKTAYEPTLFLDANTSVGTAPTPDGKSLRLLIRTKTEKVLRTLPSTANPSFQSVSVAGGTLGWFERTDKGGLQLWMADLKTGAVRQVTADTGLARFYRSDNDLVIADGRFRWVASGPRDTTEVRSVALQGGPVEVRPEPGSWRFTGWPWLVDGATSTTGATTLRNLVTGQDVKVKTTRKAATDCSPTWCQVVSLDEDGYSRIELMRPDGSARVDVAGDTANTEIVDVAPLGKFEIFVRIDANSELTGNAELLMYEIATHRTVQVSPDAGQIAYRNGVLSWSTGNLETFVRHSLDLRTIH